MQVKLLAKDAIPLLHLADSPVDKRREHFVLHVISLLASAMRKVKVKRHSVRLLKVGVVETAFLHLNYHRLRKKVLVCA